MLERKAAARSAPFGLRPQLLELGVEVRKGLFLHVDGLGQGVGA